MENRRRIMFAGPSGIGKTTLAKWVAEENGMDFISGSFSDLVPETKDLKNDELLEQPYKKIIEQDYQLLNMRHKAFLRYMTPGATPDVDIVSDRSFLDSAAYFLFKLSSKVPTCEVDQFLYNCRTLLVKECTHLIFLKFGETMIHNWITEDNNKRITNNYHQWELSLTMESILEKQWGSKPKSILSRLTGSNLQTVRDLNPKGNARTNVLIVDSADILERKRQIKNFIAL